MEEIGSILDVDTLAELVVSRTEELIPVERVGFFTLRQEDQRMVLMAHRGFDFLRGRSIRFEAEKLRMELRRPVALEQAIEPGVPFEAPDLLMMSRWQLALIFSMLSDKGPVLGFLALGARKSGQRFTVEDVDLLNAMTLQAGLAIERIELQQKWLMEHAEARRLEELNQLKSYFVSSVSHELKTPLTSIRMFAELLQLNPNISRSKATEYLSIIEGESERLTRLINNVLDFAKVERGVKEYHPVALDLNRLTQQVLQSMDYQISSAGFAVSSALSAQPLPLHADADALVQAVVNLLSNAVKYSYTRKEIGLLDIPPQRLCSDLSLGCLHRNVAGGGGEGVRTVYRAPGGAATVAGAGLGLAPGRNIVEAHGGKVEVESMIGEGSTFTLLFPTHPSPTHNDHEDYSADRG